MNFFFPVSVLLLAFIFFLCPTAPADPGYKITKIETPPGIDPQVGGIDITPSGKLAVCFHRGELAIYDPSNQMWEIFASGLHEPLGILAESDSEFLVMQRPELTRISDEDKDGVADSFETVYDGFGLSGNYHEFAFGPVRASDGGLFISLNVASNKRGVFDEIRGEWSDIGPSRQQMADGPDWKSVQEKAGRMYSRVPFRGWVVKIDPSNGDAEPWCSGLRSPNGLCVSPDGQLYITDNQGDWLGTSKLFHAQKGDFLGHPASLVWKEDWDGRNPIEIPDTELDEMRTRAAVLIPSSTMANSPSAPVVIPEGLPFAGQLISGEMNRPRILRYMLEVVDGVQQGAVTTLIDGKELTPGINHLAFDQTGTLWAGSTHLTWSGGEGIQRIQFPESPQFDVTAANLRQDDQGFELTFSQEINPELITPGAFKIRHYYFEYHAKYGSDEYDDNEVSVSSIDMREDSRAVSLGLEEVLPGYVYEISFPSLKSIGGEPTSNPLLCYTVRRLHDGTEPGSQVASVRIAKQRKWLIACFILGLIVLVQMFRTTRRRLRQIKAAKTANQ